MFFWLPIPWLCFQIGTTQNPCRCKVVGPTLGKLCSSAVPSHIMPLVT